MRILFTGSRDATPAMLKRAKKLAWQCIRKKQDIVVGDAGGVDAEVIRICNLHKYARVTVWGAYGMIRHGAACGVNKVTYADYPRRDLILAGNCDVCIAIWNGRSRGTIITVNYAKELGKRVQVIDFSKDYDESIDKFNQNGGSRTSGIDKKD